MFGAITIVILTTVLTEAFREGEESEEGPRHFGFAISKLPMALS